MEKGGFTEHKFTKKGFYFKKTSHGKSLSTKKTSRSYKLSFLLQHYSLSLRGGCGCVHTHLFMRMQRAKVCVVSPPLLLLTLCRSIWLLPKAGSLQSLDTGLSFSAHT